MSMSKINFYEINQKQWQYRRKYAKINKLG